MRRIAALACAASLLGCGSGEDPTGPRAALNSGGIGNQTLSVQADIDVDDLGGGFLTAFRVSVSDREGAPVSDASVLIEGGFGPLSLGEESAGDYRGELTGAPWGTLSLTVEKDSMFVQGIVLGNIGIHTFIAPSPDDTVAANEPFVVRWFRDAEAPLARLSTRDVTLSDIFDSGELVLADSQNPARSAQLFELVRWNEVQIAGGLRGSYFRLEVTNSIEGVVVE